MLASKDKVKNNIVLDPFIGSSTSGLAAYMYGRKFIGIDTEKEYLNLEKIDVFEPAIYLYDKHPGGIGFSPVLFREHSELLSKSAMHISACQCLDGCPSCVGPMNEIGMRGKEVAQNLLKELRISN